MEQQLTKIYWDLDGTLWGPKQNEIEIVATATGIRLNNDFEKQFYAMLAGTEDFFKDKRVTRKLFERYIDSNIPELQKQNISCAEFLNLWEQTNARELIPGAKEVLQGASEKGIMNIAVTNWSWKAQMNSLKLLGLLEYVDQVHAWDDAYPKNHPTRAAMIVRQGGADQVMVGNSWTDIKFAQLSGIKSVLYDPTGTKQFPGYVPDKRVQDLREIIKMF